MRSVCTECCCSFLTKRELTLLRCEVYCTNISWMRGAGGGGGVFVCVSSFRIKKGKSGHRSALSAKGL